MRRFGLDLPKVRLCDDSEFFVCICFVLALSLGWCLRMACLLLTRLKMLYSWKGLSAAGLSVFEIVCEEISDAFLQLPGLSVVLGQEG